MDFTNEELAAFEAMSPDHWKDGTGAGSTIFRYLIRCLAASGIDFETNDNKKVIARVIGSTGGLKLNDERVLECLRTLRELRKENGGV